MARLSEHQQAGDFAVISWANLGQGGAGHVNCHSSRYVQETFEALGRFTAVAKARLTAEWEVRWRRRHGS